MMNEVLGSFCQMERKMHVAGFLVVSVNPSKEHHSIAM